MCRKGRWLAFCLRQRELRSARFPNRRGARFEGRVDAQHPTRMSNEDEADRLKESARIHEYHASLTWTPLSDRFPPAGEHVLVKMHDGHVEGGRWDEAGKKWYDGAFTSWKVPTSWASVAKASAGK